MICINNNHYLAEFERVIESHKYKDQLLSILESRLNGSFEIINLNDDFMVSFNFHKTLSDIQNYYLEMFDEHYYPKQLICDTEYLHKIIEPVVQKIKNNYDNMIQFMSKKPDSIKHIYIYFSKYSEQHFDLNILFEYCLILPKLKVLETILVQHFHTVLDTDFHSSKLFDTSKPFDFNTLYTKIYDHILESIQIKVEKSSHSSLYDRVRPTMNGLFWIVYANEFKFVDNVQKKHLIREEDHEKYQEKVSKWFKYEDEVVTETGEVHRSERDMLNEVFDFMEKVNEISYMKLEKKMQELDPGLDYETIDRCLEEELDRYIDTLTNDEDEKRMYKITLRLNITNIFVEEMVKQVA